MCMATINERMNACRIRLERWSNSCMLIPLSTWEYRSRSRLWCGRPDDHLSPTEPGRTIYVSGYFRGFARGRQETNRHRVGITNVRFQQADSSRCRLPLNLSIISSSVSPWTSAQPVEALAILNTV